MIALLKKDAKIDLGVKILLKECDITKEEVLVVMMDMDWRILMFQRFNGWNDQEMISYLNKKDEKNDKISDTKREEVRGEFGKTYRKTLDSKCVKKCIK